MNSTLRTSLAIILLFCWGCFEISFEQPQPEGVKSLDAVPKEIRGKYLSVAADGTISTDTLIVHAQGYRFAYADPENAKDYNESTDEGFLSDSVKLKSYKGYYFLNLKSDDEWMLRVFRPGKKGDLTYMAMESKGDEDFKDYLNRLSVEIRIDSLESHGSMVYRIHPTPGKLLELIDKGFFSELKLKKLN